MKRGRSSVAGILTYFACSSRLV